MSKILLVVLLVFCYTFVYSQQNILIFKKGLKTINRFWLGSFFAFQLENKQWQKGQLTRIQNDSFYIRPMVVRYSLMKNDTIYHRVTGFAIADVFAMPKKGILIDYIDGRFQISRTGGHVHWYWIKSGWMFRVGGAGYAALNVTNGFIKNEPSFKDGNLGIAAGTFLFGLLLKRIYKPTFNLKNKYHLETIHLSK